MAMLHDTFCTHSTINKHNLINETTCINNHTLRVDTLFRLSSNNNSRNNYTSSPPSLRSSNSSLTTVSSATSSNDESSIVNEDQHKLTLWVQRQLGFYTALSIIPSRFSCVDDGKLFLCLIHRFAPHTLPRLVDTLDDNTTSECLTLADDLAQQLWSISSDSLVIYLHRRFQNTSMMTLADYIDSLLSSPLSTTATPDRDDNGQFSLCNNYTEDDENDVQRHAPTDATPIPIWQRRKQIDSHTRWISATHQSIHSYLHHPHTSRFSILLSLLDQLAGIYADFTKLPPPASALDYILPTHQLLGRIQLMKNQLSKLTTTTNDDDGLASLLDILVQRHAWLLARTQQALELFEKANKVQSWVTKMQQTTLATMAQDDEQGKCRAWLNDVWRYRQEDQDVLALESYIFSPSSLGDGMAENLVARVTKPTVIKALDELDALMAQAKQVEQQFDWYSMLAKWEGTYGAASLGLKALDDSVQQLIQQTTITCKISNINKEVSHQSLLQQWKILSRRLAHIDYSATICLYQKLLLLGSPVTSPRMVSVEKDYTGLMQQSKQVSASLDLARQRIAQHKRFEDFLHQCHVVQINATELERQLGATGGSVMNLCDKLWMKDQVGEMNKTIAGVLASSTGNFGGADDVDDDLVHYWKDVLSRCQLNYHQAWVKYQSKWSHLERQCELETIKQVMNAQLDILESCLFDPWTHSVDDVGGLKHGHVDRKRHFMRMVMTRFDQWIKASSDNGGQDDEQQLCVDIRMGIEMGEKLLMDYDQRLDILGIRRAWERQWSKTSKQVQHTTNALHLLVGSTGNTTMVMDDIQDHKHTLEQVQQTLDGLLVLNNGEASAMVDRMCQRQQLLKDQVNNLDGLLDATHMVHGQISHVNSYMVSVDNILNTSQSLGSSLEAGLLSPDGGELVDQQGEVEALATSAVLLWQHTGSRIPYPASFLVVDDLVRWKVLVAFGDVMTAVMHLVVGVLTAYTKRTEWETQWAIDMDGLRQAHQHFSLWLQQLDGDDASNIWDGNTIDAIVDRYYAYPFHQLDQYFVTMQQAYSVNLNIPMALKERQQQLTMHTYGHIKSLCGLFKYLQVSKQLKDVCDHMNSTLDQKGVDASEDLVQQWMDDIKVRVEQDLFSSLCDQQVQLRNGVDGFGKEKVLLVREKSSAMLGDLKGRLATTLKASQHSRLVQAYGQSATVLELSLHMLQDDLASLVNENSKVALGANGVTYQEYQESLRIKWKGAKLALESTHTVSYNDIRSLSQLILLQQDESDIVKKQSQLDELWQAVWQEVNGVQELLASLAQWRDFSSSLDKTEAKLTSLDQWMDVSTMVVRDDVDEKEVVDNLSRIYRDTHAILAMVRGVVLPCGAAKAILMRRLDDSSGVVDGLRTALACFAHQRTMNERAVVLDRLDLWMDMSLFYFDGTQTLLIRSWDMLKTQAETSRMIYGLLAPLLSLCESKPFLNNDKGNGDGSLLEICRDSMNSLSLIVEMEQYCHRGLLSIALECGKQASSLLSGLDRFGKDLVDFELDGTTNELMNWQLDIHVWQHKMVHYEQTELRIFLETMNGWLSSLDGLSDGGDNDNLVKLLGDHVGQCMQGLVQDVKTRWEEIKAQLKNVGTEVTSWQLKKVAEQQWQDLLDLLENACNRTMMLVSGFYHSDDPMMLSQEQDLMETQQSLTTLAYETRPILAMKANEVKTSLNALTTTWIDHGDVDRALDGWEQTLLQHQQHLHHAISMCQYWVAAAEVEENLCILNQLLDDGEKTKFKVYMDVLDTSLEKTRQVATLVEGSGRTEYALLVAKRNKLERQFNTHQRWLGVSTGSGLQRIRKISLPSKMPSQNLMGRTPNAYVADPQNDLDMEIGRIVNRVPYKVELNMVPGEAGRYRFGSKVVYCRILKSRMVMVRVGGGWTELSQFLRDHALLVGSKSTTTTADGCQEMYLDTKRATSPTSGRPLLLPRMSQSTTTTTTPSSISDNAGYKDGDRYIAMDIQGQQHEMKMTPHDSNNSDSNRRYS